MYMLLCVRVSWGPSHAACWTVHSRASWHAFRGQLFECLGLCSCCVRGWGLLAISCKPHLGPEASLGNAVLSFKLQVNDTSMLLQSGVFYGRHQASQQVPAAAEDALP